MKEKYSYRLSINIDKGGAGMSIASLDHVRQITNKSCLGNLSYSLQGIVRFRGIISACHYKLFIKLHAAPMPLKDNYLLREAIKVEKKCHN